MTIEFKSVSKHYKVKGKQVNALHNINLTIEKGEIFGLIGFSGAGKSTLIRLINALETPSSGHVTVDNVELNQLSKKQLREKRRKIGMVFQQFNLIETKSVFDNVAFVLKAAGVPKKTIKQRVDELLKLVGLSDKTESFPKNLSGGQKQRVGIARALANDPDILLCDEVTSALDPETTKSILNLIKNINQQLKITVVFITHEPEVVKALADRVAVMSAGEIVEVNDVYQIFSQPNHKVTQGFVKDVYDFELPEEVSNSNEGEIITLKFLSESAEDNYLNQVYEKFNLNISILNGRIEYIKGQPLGVLMLRVKGLDEDIEKFLEDVERTPNIERMFIYE